MFWPVHHKTWLVLCFALLLLHGLLSLGAGYVYGFKRRVKPRRRRKGIQRSIAFGCHLYIVTSKYDVDGVFFFFLLPCRAHIVLRSSYCCVRKFSGRASKHPPLRSAVMRFDCTILLLSFFFIHLISFNYFRYFTLSDHFYLEIYIAMRYTVIFFFGIGCRLIFIRLCVIRVLYG